jgi:membrane protein YdbS with pleckstrin-like domain
MRYPQLHRRPEQVALTSVIESMLLLLPLVIFIAGFWVSIGLMAHLLALTTVVLLIVVYALVTLSTHVNTWPVGLTAQPLAIAIDILLLNYSMLRYEFTTVDWKGREVGAPVMHAAHQFQGEETLTAN